MISEEKLETKSPDAVPLISGLSLMSRFMEEHRMRKELFKQKNAASPRMKASGCTVCGILK